MSIFREQVIKKGTGQLSGDVLLNQPFSLKLTIVSFSVLFLMAVVAAIHLEYGRHIAVQGWFKSIPPIQEVTLSKNGIVKELFFQAGDSVKAGDVIAIISHPDKDKSGEDRRQSEIIRQQLNLTQLEDQYSADHNELINRKALINEKISLHKRDIRILNKTLNTAKSNLELNEKQVERVSKTVEQNHASQSELESVQQQLLMVEQSVNDIERQIILEEKSINELQKEVGRVDSQKVSLTVEFESNKRQIEAQIDRLENESETVVVAMIDGVIEDLHVTKHELVFEGDVMINVTPDDIKWEVEVMLPTNISANIESGDKVKLAVSAFPYQTYGHLEGTIDNIDKSVYQTDRRLGQVSSPSFRATIIINDFKTSKGKVIAPKQGMLVTSNIITQKESILAKILRPINDIREHFDD